MTQVFAVQFSRPWWQGRRTDNTLGLQGAGWLRCTGQEVSLAQQRGSTAVQGRPAPVWSARQVFNVQRTGRSVAFSVFGHDRMLEQVCLWCPDPAAARAVQQALPDHVLADSARSLHEHHVFQDRLEACTVTPRCTPLLLALIVLVFVLAAAAGAGVWQPQAQVLVAWGTNFGPLTLHGQIWRLFTALFLHFGLLHLLFNLSALASVGALAERLFGGPRFLLIYLAAGMGGNLLSVLWNPPVNSAGASGAIFGVFGALLAYFLDPRTGVPLSIVQQQRRRGVAVILINLLFGLSQPGIDNAAHLGGLACGFLLGRALARPLEDLPGAGHPAAG